MTLKFKVKGARVSVDKFAMGIGPPLAVGAGETVKALCRGKMVVAQCFASFTIFF